MKRPANIQIGTSLAACLVAVALFIAAPTSTSTQNDSSATGESSSQTQAAQTADSSSQTGESATAAVAAASTTQPQTVAYTTTSSDSITFSVSDDELPAHEAGTVLVQIDAGTNKAQLEEMLAGVEGFDTSEVTEEDLAAGIAVLKITNGNSVSAAAAELEQLKGIDGAQPNYIYTIAESTTSTSNSTASTSSSAASSTSANNSTDSTATSVSSSTDSTVSTSSSIVSASEDTADASEITTSATLNDSYAASQWALSSVNAYSAWDSIRTSGTVSVAVIDTGADTDHPDLASNIKATYNTSNGSSNAEDSYGHGTHVAGIISSVANNGMGTAGVSYNAGLVIIKASTGSTSDFTTENLTKAYTWLRNNASSYNIRVVNMSIGGYENGAETKDDALTRQIDAAYNEGILTVCAAGNDTTRAVPYSCYPGDHATALSVMNLQKGSNWSSSNNIVSLSSSSNYNVSGSSAKDICAPGTSIYSTTMGGSYGTMSGTSMASPLVAGVAALTFSANSSLSAQQCMNVLENTANDLGATGWDTTYGYGEVNAAAAVINASNSAYVSASSTLKNDVSATVSGSSSVDVGRTATYTVSTSDEWSDLSWTWGVSDTSIATIGSSSGVLSAVSPGTVTVTATCISDPTITASMDVTVAQASITSSNGISISVASQTYTGSALTPSVTVTYGFFGLTQTLVEGRDYTITSYSNNVNAGTGSVTITGRGRFRGTSTATFTINAKSISGASIGSVGSYTYTGSAITPTPTVSLNGYGVLTAGTDYTYSYANNIDVGTATVTAVGTGNFTGSAGVNFPIEAPLQSMLYSTTPVASEEMYRLYNPNSGEHFYTADAGERDSVVAAGWSYEGVGWYGL